MVTELSTRSNQLSNDFSSSLVLEDDFSPFDVLFSDNEPVISESTLKFSSSPNTFHNTKQVEAEPNKGRTIDQKLTFILGSVRRKIRRQIKIQKKQIVRRIPRKRKTQEQLNILRTELNDHTDFNKNRLENIAVKTGLNPSQVYKWYWEHRRKAIQ